MLNNINYALAIKAITPCVAITATKLDCLLFINNFSVVSYVAYIEATKPATGFVARRANQPVP